MSPWGAPQREDHGEQIVTTRCFHCPETHEGTLDDGRAWYADHAKDEHDIVAKPRLRRLKRRPSWRAQKALEDNIAGARAEGAARWVDDSDRE